MSSQQTNQSDQQTNLELRIRTMRVVWIALLLSIGAYYIFTIIAGRSENAVPNQTVSMALLGGAVFAFIASFPIKSKLLSKAVEQQQTGMVQQAYVVAWGITEVGALLGVVDFFLTGNRFYFAPLIIAAFGQLLHFPRREAVLNAAFKNTL
jgi:hypothetical protein